MGLPASTDPTPSAPQNNTANNAPTASTETPKIPSELPPAALDLAAKLFDLSRNGETSSLSTYLSAGIPKNLTNHSGDTLLMLAAYHGHAETVSMLLTAGSDPNVLNGRGQSPIAGAVFKGWDEVVKTLFEGGADIGLGQPNAVDCARMFRKEEYLRWFGVDQGIEEAAVSEFNGATNGA